MRAEPRLGDRLHYAVHCEVSANNDYALSSFVFKNIWQYFQIETHFRILLVQTLMYSTQT
jgi:hypothetical protein